MHPSHLSSRCGGTARRGLLGITGAAGAGWHPDVHALNPLPPNLPPRSMYAWTRPAGYATNGAGVHLTVSAKYSAVLRTDEVR